MLYRLLLICDVFMGFREHLKMFQTGVITKSVLLDRVHRLQIILTARKLKLPCKAGAADWRLSNG